MCIIFICCDTLLQDLEVCRTSVAQTDVAWTNIAKTDVAWTNVAWTNATWSNGTGPLVNSQGWFHKLEMSSTVLSLGGWGGGWGKVEINAISAQHSWNWA